MLVWWLVEGAWNIDSGTRFLARDAPAEEIWKWKGSIWTVAAWPPHYWAKRKNSLENQYNWEVQPQTYLEGKKIHCVKRSTSWSISLYCIFISSNKFLTLKYIWNTSDSRNVYCAPFLQEVPPQFISLTNINGKCFSLT